MYRVKYKLYLMNGSQVMTSVSLDFRPQKSDTIEDTTGNKWRLREYPVLISTVELTEESVCTYVCDSYSRVA